MAVAKEELQVNESIKKRKRGASRKPRSKTGGTAAKRASTKAPEKKPEKQSGAEVEGVDGAKVLQVTANEVAVKRSYAIANGLATMAARGNPGCTKMLLDLMAGKTVAPKKLLRAVSRAQELKMDKPWKGEEAGNS
jgi:hypothetical protein